MTDADATRQHPIVLYDGLCGLCDAAVQRLIARDHKRVLRFASLQSPAGQLLLEEHRVPTDLSTMVLIDTGRAYVRSHAMLCTLGHLGWPWKLTRVLVIVPAALMDPAYRLVARNRFRIRGRLEACRVPKPVDAERFLESPADLAMLKK